MISLKPMTAAEFAATQSQMWRDYQDSWIAAGDSPVQAEAKAEAARRAIIPDGTLPAGHHALHAVVEGRVIGHAWLAERFPGSWYIYEVDIRAPYREQGLGRAVAAAVERFAISRGAVRIECNVFAANAAATALVGSEGYRQATAIMAKSLGDDDGGTPLQR